MLSRLTSFGITIGALGYVTCGGSTHNPAKVDLQDSEAQAIDAGFCSIQTSKYEQTCSSDSDCVTMAGTFPVQSGDYCKPMCLCGGGTISIVAVAQYVADVSKTPLGSGAIPPEFCGCVLNGTPCCETGQCTFQCPVVPFIPAEAASNQMADAASGPPQGSTVMCGLNLGPFDAGTDAGGPWRWCQVGESCVPFNGGWACCMIQPSGGFAVCAAPLAGSAGN
jgi:hypothetical protein